MPGAQLGSQCSRLGVITLGGDIGSVASPLTNLPGIAANDARSGTGAWGSVNSSLAEDGSVATWIAASSSTVGQYLKDEAFNFGLPWNAVISGITIKVKAYVGTSPANTINVQPVKSDGTAAGSPQSFTPTTSTAWYTSTSAWSSLTPADVSGPGFGVLVQSVGARNSEVTSVDAVTVTIAYTVPHATGRTVGLTQTQSVSQSVSATRTLPLTQGATPLVTRSRSVERSPSPQAQAVAVVRTIRRVQAMTQAQATTLARVAARVQAITQAQSAKTGSQFAGQVSATQAQTPTHIGQVSRTQTVAQSQAIGRSRDLSRLLAISQAQSATQSARLTMSVTMDVTQSQAVAVVRPHLSTLSVSQSAAVRLTVQHQLLRSVTQAATPRLTRRAARTIGVQAMASPTHGGRKAATVFAYAEQQVEAAHTRTRVRFVIAYQTTTVTPWGGKTRRFGVTQRQSTGLGRALARGFALAQAQGLTRKVKYPPHHATSVVELEVLADVAITVLPDANLSVEQTIGDLEVEVSA